MPQGKTSSITTRPAGRIRFRADVAEKIAARHGATTDHERAAFFGVSASAYSRVTNEKRRPGEEFIASVLSASSVDEEVSFDALFEVERDGS